MASSSSEQAPVPAPVEGGDGASGLRPWRPALVPAPAGRPNGHDVLELLLFALVLALAFATPARTPAGEPNAPLMRTIDEATGGGLCLWKRLLDRPCAGCGLTRGFVQLAHGDLVEALHLNPMTPVVFAWVAWHTLGKLVLVVGRRELFHGIPATWVGRLYGAFGIGFVVLGIVRFALGVERL